MKYRRVLLVNPPYPGSLFGPLRPPSNIGYLAEALRQNGIEYAILDMGLGYGLRNLLKKIDDFETDLLCVSMMSYMYRHTYKLLAKTKKIFKDLHIAVGGPHIAAFREKVLKECPAIDYAVLGEGESTLIELCQKDKPEDIKGLFYRRGGEISYTQDRDFIDELDRIPFPRYQKFQLEKYITKELDIVTTRGCPYQCIYCTVDLSCGNRVRFRSPRAVVEEIGYWHRRGYRRFQIADDNFTIDRGRVLEICNLIAKSGVKDLIFRCGNGLRADRMDAELLLTMKKVGFKHIAIGVESGSDKVLKVLKKGERLDVVQKSIKTACQLGFDITLFFLVGSPSETLVDFMDSINLAKMYPIVEAKFFNLIPYPRTELYNWVGKNAHFNYSPEIYLNKRLNGCFFKNPIFYTKEFPQADRIKALKLADKTERTIIRHTIKRKFRRLGMFGKVGGLVYSSDFVRGLFKTNRFLRRLVELAFENW